MCLPGQVSSAARACYRTAAEVVCGRRATEVALDGRGRLLTLVSAVSDSRASIAMPLVAVRVVLPSLVPASPPLRAVSISVVSLPATPSTLLAYAPLSSLVLKLWLLAVASWRDVGLRLGARNCCSYCWPRGLTRRATTAAAHSLQNTTQLQKPNATRD